MVCYVIMFHGLNSFVYCCQQPDHLLDDANSAGKKLGEVRALRSSYLFKSLLDADTHLAFGSDWPVSFLKLYTYNFECLYFSGSYNNVLSAFCFGR